MLDATPGRLAAGAQEPGFSAEVAFPMASQGRTEPIFARAPDTRSQPPSPLTHKVPEPGARPARVTLDAAARARRTGLWVVAALGVVLVGGGLALTRPWATKAEVAPPEAAKREVARPTVAKPDVAKPLVAMPDAVKKPDVVKPVAVKREVEQPVVARPDVAKSRVVKPADPKVDQTARLAEALSKHGVAPTAAPDPTKAEPPRAEPPKAEPPKADPPKPEPAKSDPANPEPAAPEAKPQPLPAQAPQGTEPEAVSP